MDPTRNETLDRPPYQVGSSPSGRKVEGLSQTGHAHEYLPNLVTVRGERLLQRWGREISIIVTEQAAGNFPRSGRAPGRRGGMRDFTHMARDRRSHAGPLSAT